MSRVAQGPQLADLIGRISSTSDAVTTKNRNRYLQTSTVGPNSFFRVVVPRLGPNSYLDCRSIRMRCFINVSSTDPNCVIDANQVFPFSRVRVFSGSMCLLDINEAHLLNALTYNSTAESTEAGYERHTVGDDDLTQKVIDAASGSTEYLFPCMPSANTFWRGKHLLDMNGADMFLEFYTLTNAQYLYSALDAAPSYTLNNIEILSEYITSPSIGAYYRANPMSFTAWDWRQLYQAMSAQLENVRLPSSNTSLNGFFSVMRDITVESKVSNQDKYTTYNSNDFTNVQLLVNQQPWWDEPLTPYPQIWRELKDFWPQVYSAVYYDLSYQDTTAGHFVFGTSISAMPAEFQFNISSGVRTSLLNNDIVLQWTFPAPLGTQQRIDSFLQADVIFRSQGEGREILISY